MTRAKTVVKWVLALLLTQNAVLAAEPAGKGDPNLPVTGGDVRPVNAVNEDHITRVTWLYNDPEDLTSPSIQFEYNLTQLSRVRYLGYNDAGSWVIDFRGVVFTFKDRTVTNTHLSQKQLPEGLKNATPDYLGLTRKQGATGKE